jgi:hypothetical protein
LDRVGFFLAVTHLLPRRRRIGTELAKDSGSSCVSFEWV